MVPAPYPCVGGLGFHPLTPDQAFDGGDHRHRFELEHVEIEDNLWVNEPEDLNQNGRLDPDDINGIDDDGNGFVDDVVGWDFAGDDNDPAGDSSPRNRNRGLCFGRHG